jgi:hypothetical protein
LIINRHRPACVVSAASGLLRAVDFPTLVQGKLPTTPASHRILRGGGRSLMLTTSIWTHSARRLFPRASSHGRY